MPYRSLALFALTPILAAQQNAFVVFPQDPEHQTITSASYVRRPNWTQQAEGLQQIDAAWFRGVGDTGSGCLAHAMFWWAADEDITTAEGYGVVLRLADVNGAPDATPTGILLSIQGLSTPAGAGGPRGSWIMTDGFATPLALPCDQTWFQGIDLPANTAWPATDGLSLWAADGLAAASPPTVGENHRLGAPNITWSVDTTFATSASRPWTYILGVRVDAPVLHLGGIDPLSARTGTLGASSYGMNGLFPELPTDGLDARVQDNANPNGFAVLAGALDYGPPLGFGYPGQLWLDLPTLVTVGFAVMSGGVGTIPIAAPGSLPASAIGIELKFQAMVFDLATGNGRFANAQTVLL
jgi:hypothetical protein